jgi:pyruvate,water dikinase
MTIRRDAKFIHWFSELGIRDVPIVGGKNASLGEMFSKLTGTGVRIPDGFAISAGAYDYYVDSSGVKGEVASLLKGLNIRDTRDLAQRGARIRALVRGTPLPKDLERAIVGAYDELSRRYGAEVDTAVRSSATAEDLPDASFAGQQDTYLNVRGHDRLLESCRACFASLFTDRAIAYREEKGFDHFAVSLSIAVQKMVRSDLASAGVMFSIDTESGFKDAVYVTGGFGLGENVVQGAINPDEWYVHKPGLQRGLRPIIHSRLGEKQQKMIYTDPAKGKATENVPVPPEQRATFCLSEDEVLELARWAVIIEDHYSQEAGHFKPMDMEWAKDGQSGELFIVQARPETVVSRREAGTIRRVVLEKTSAVMAEGMAVGALVGAGKALVIRSAEQISDFQPGMVLVTKMTDPDWVPIMKVASAIVTDQGGRTCHAAIISRELGLPCVVGTGNATQLVKTGQGVTVSCAGGSKGVVYEGILPFKEETIRVDELAKPSMAMLYHESEPDRAFPDSFYPNAGVGLLRVDEIMRDEVKVHPLACLNYPELDRDEIDKLTVGYPDKRAYFVTKLAEGVGRIAAAFHPKPVWALLSDATSRDLLPLIGGKSYAYDDANPLMGTRGLGRYSDLDYEEAFRMELEALARVRTVMGLTNLAIVLPACQTSKDARALAHRLAQAGLKRGSEGLELHLLCHTPAQLLTLEQFAENADGFLIHVGELAQHTLGIDAGNVLMRPYFDDKHLAVLSLIRTALGVAKRLGKPMGLSGIAGASLPFYTRSIELAAADFVVLRPEVFPLGRDLLMEAGNRAA